MYVLFVVIELLKRYYTVLCESITSNVVICASALMRRNFINQSFANKLKTCGSPLKAKQLVVDALIRHIDCEERMVDFCDAIDDMVDSEMKHTVESFRNGTVAVYFISV